jgi:hypothetical protein
VIANFGTPVPGGSGSFTSLGAFPGVSATTVAFEGGGSTSSGVYTGTGGALTKVADTSTAIPGGSLGNFTAFGTSEAIAGATVAFRGSGSSSIGIYTATGGALTTIADTNTAIPGFTGNFTNLGISPSLSGSTLAFFGRGSPSFVGVYTGSGGAITAVADTNTAVPGGSGNFTTFGNPSVAGSLVAFNGTDSSNHTGIYLEQGSALGKLLAPGDTLDGKTVSTLVMSSGSLSGTSLVFNVTFTDGSQGVYVASIPAGAWQGNPLLPTTASGGNFGFVNAASGQWFDPPLLSGYTYQMTSGSLFTGILGFPTGFSSPFQVFVGGSLLGIFGPSQTVSFSAFPGGGVSSFTIAGFNPVVDGANTAGFPLELGFSTANASFTMTGVAAVPEPRSLILLGQAALVLAAAGTVVRRPSAGRASLRRAAP